MHPVCAPWGKPVVIALLAALITLSFRPKSLSADRYRATYQEKIVRFTRVNPADATRLTALEKNGLRKTEEIRQVVKVVDSNNDLTTTITVLSTNEYESWMKKGVKFITGKNGTTVLDQNNNQLSTVPLSAVAQQDYQRIKARISTAGLQVAPLLPAVSDAQITEIQRTGGQISRLANGSVKMTKGDLEVWYDANNKAYQIIQKQQGKIMSQEYHDFMERNGQMVPVSKVEKQYETLPSGICLERVTMTTYSNYSFTSTP